MTVDIQVGLFLLGVLLSVWAAIARFVVVRGEKFAEKLTGSIDKLTDAVGELREDRTEVRAILGEHGRRHDEHDRRLDGHDEGFKRVDQRCFEMQHGKRFERG